MGFGVVVGVKFDSPMKIEALSPTSVILPAYEFEF